MQDEGNPCAESSVSDLIQSDAASKPPDELPLSIQIENLSKWFGNRCAIDSLSLQIHEGEFFGFLGPNGAGKSTTIRMLCGLLRPDSGNAMVAGCSILTQTLELKRVIGALPEEPALYERLTGFECLRFAGQMYGLERKEAQERASDLLGLMELTDERNKLIVDYSMGMKKKIALASALIHSPRVMFLDEPFNGIDPISVRSIRNVLRHLSERGTTIFISSHVMEVIERLCSRVAIINQGKLVGVGTLSELRNLSNVSSDTSLEDVFLKMVDANVDTETLSWL